MNTRHLLSIALLGAVIGFGSCQKEPSTSSLRDEYLVYTAYDQKADFQAITTYYIPDSILLIGPGAVDDAGNKVAKYWKDQDALALIGAVVAELDARGYTRIADPLERQMADVGLQLSYVEETTYFVGYNDPYWWGYYPYYWDPGYWGSWWGGWYYPFRTYYGYTTGSLLQEMVDLTAEESSDRKLPVIWNSYISGLLHGNNAININEAVEAIDQAFEQSPYLKK